MTIFAVISGAESWEDIEDFGETHLDFLSNMVILKMVFLFTIPLPELYPVSVLQNFTSALLTGCVTAILQMINVIAIDGKTLLGHQTSRRRGAIHVISAFSTMHSLVIGQIKTDKKSNEITAIPELLNMLDIKEKSSQLMRWVARKILQRRYKNREVIIYSR
ncbi:ISAs1 family transposase [Escherichia coli]